MGINFKVVKPKNPIVQAHATTQLDTQHQNLSIWLNKILPPSKRLTIILFFSFSNYVPISILPSSSFCITITLYLSFSCCDAILPFCYSLLLNIILLMYLKFLHFRSNSKGMKEKKMQKVKWERGSHIYTQWANLVVFRKNYVVYQM